MAGHSDSIDKTVEMGPHVVTAARCLVLRIMEVVAEFSLKGVLREDLIDRWQEAFQRLEALDVGRGQPCQLSPDQLGINMLHPGYLSLYFSYHSRSLSFSP